MFNLIYLPEFWIGTAMGGIVALLLLIIFLSLLGLSEEAAEPASAEAVQFERRSRPRHFYGSNPDAPAGRKPTAPANPPPYLGYQRTARSEMRSQLK